jgi:superfamily II DNA or RNA helicase
MVILRDYQEECRDAVLAALGEKPWWDGQSETFRSTLINLATSGGKTVIAGAIIFAVRDRGKCLFLADTDELCDQPRKKFYRLFGMHAALEKAGDKASMMSDVVIGSAQTFMRENRLQRFPPNHFKFIFVDEAHRGSDRNKKITDYFTEAKIIGQTATAFRAKLADLSDYYEHVAYELGVFDLVNEGFNTPLKVLTLPVSVDLSKVHQSMSTEAGGMDYNKEELDTTIAPYYEEICRLVLKHAADRHIICYLPLIKSSQEFVTIAKSMGIIAKHIDGKSPDRVQLLREFEDGGIQILSNSSLLTTGWDCPRCDCLLNLAPTRSAGLFRQKAGRIGRVLPGVVDGIENRDERKRRIAASAKPDALILDLLWQTERFGLMGPADLIAANAEEKEAIQMRIRRLTAAEDLQEVTSAVQEEREEALRVALEEAAKKRTMLTDAVELIAAVLHGRKVLTYEPVVNWERKPVSEKQKEWLEKQGIDPGTAKDRGHVSKLMDLLFQRRKAGLAPWRAVQALEKRKIPHAIHMTDWQAYEILGGDYPFPFGKQARQKRTLRQVPVSYLSWCADPSRDWIRKQYPIVADWIKRTINHGYDEQGPCTCIGAYRAPNCPVHPREEVFKPGKAGEAERQTESATVDLFDNLDA